MCITEVIADRLEGTRMIRSPRGWTHEQNSGTSPGKQQQAEQVFTCSNRFTCLLCSLNFMWFLPKQKQTTMACPHLTMVAGNQEGTGRGAEGTNVRCRVSSWRRTEHISWEKRRTKIKPWSLLCLMTPECVPCPRVWLTYLLKKTVFSAPSS